jgi:mono/diheme cytochrome c family protein
MSLKLKNLESVEVNPAPLSKVEKVKTKILFERDHSCIACHESVNLVGTPRGGISGPSLLNAGNRLQASWVYLWLKNPETFQPRSRMPRAPLDEKALTNLTRYVLSHKKNALKP